MKKQFLALILISLILFSCKNSEHKVFKEKPSKFYIFDIGYNTNRIIQKIIEKDNELFLGVFHRVYSKEISIYNMQQKKTLSIPVEKYHSENNPIININFFNLDTIALTTKHQISYFINSKSKLLKKINFNNHPISLKYYLSNMYYLSSKKILFSIAYNDKDNPFYATIANDYCKYLKYFTKKTYSLKRIAVINDIYKDKISIQKYLNNFELNYTDTNHFVNVAFYQLYVHNNNLFMYGGYSDFIFKISLNDFSLQNKIKIKSKYNGNLFTRRFTLKGSCVDSLIKIGNTKGNGSIIKLYFSNYTQKYYVFVRRNTQKQNDARYSIIAYDKEFNKIGESNPFKATTVLFSQKGVFIALDKSNKNYERNKLKYNYYEFIK